MMDLDSSFSYTSGGSSTDMVDTSGDHDQSFWTFSERNDSPLQVSSSIKRQESLSPLSGSLNAAILDEVETQCISRWRPVAPLENREPDFGSLNKGYGRVLTFRFYLQRETNLPMAQIGDFEEVPVTEVVKCLNKQTVYGRSINIEIRIDNCDEKDLQLFKQPLLRLLHGCRMKPNVPEVERCVLIMKEYTHVGDIASIIADNMNRLFELNIGERRIPDTSIHRVNADDEADAVIALLQTWIVATCRTIRCVRVYPFIIVDNFLASLLSSCTYITHLTLSKILCITSCPIFIRIQSFELDGCGLSFTKEDKEFAKRLTVHFPDAKVFGMTDVCFDPVLVAFIRHVNNLEGKYSLYQAVSLEKMAAMLHPMYNILEPKDKCENRLDLESRQFGTKLSIYRPGQSYRSPLY